MRARLTSDGERAIEKGSLPPDAPGNRDFVREPGGRETTHVLPCYLHGSLGSCGRESHVA